jgi:hypothetical protein
MAMIPIGLKGRAWRCQECGKWVWTIEKPLSIGPLLDGQAAWFWEINTLFRLRLCRKCWLDREARKEVTKVAESQGPYRCPYCGAELDYPPHPERERFAHQGGPCGGDPSWHEGPELDE